MKVILSPLSALALVFTLPLSAAPQQVDAYFIYGQSNANGRSYSKEFTNKALRQPYDANIHYAYHELAWKDGSNPVEIPLGAIRPDPLNRVGVEVTLGRYLSAHSPRPVLLVKFCSGGTSIKNFLPSSNNLFPPMVAYLKGKEAEMSKLGYQVNWKGAFVITGESDSGEVNAPKFKDRFLTVQSALEKELNLTSLPITYSLLRGNWIDTPASAYSRHDEWAALINREMSALASSDALVRVTPSNANLKTRLDNGNSKTDGIHYSSDSYALLGSRLYSTTFPKRSSVIDRNGNSLSDVWEFKHPSNQSLSPEASKEKLASLLGTDKDQDGVTDWAEQQLEGFDINNSDSFSIGQEQNDLIVLLSMIDGTKKRQASVTPDWTEVSEEQSAGTFGDKQIKWIGPQHKTTTSAGAIITTNSKGSSTVSHQLTFDKAINNLQITVAGMSKTGQVTFDTPFSLLENLDKATQDGNALKGNGMTDSLVRIQFKNPVTTLSITTPGNDATKFIFKQNIEVPGSPLKWRK